MKEKSTLRQEMRTHLRGLAKSEIRLASEQICHHLTGGNTSPISPLQEQTIALFSPHGPEICLTSLHALLPQAKLVYPLCHLGGILTFHHIPHPDELTPGTKGILEPDPEHHPDIAIPAIDVFLCPGIAFGRDFTRLGQGGGFYDRALHQKSSDATTAGIGLQCQILESVPHAAHDIHLDLVLTERGFI